MRNITEVLKGIFGCAHRIARSGCSFVGKPSGTTEGANALRDGDCGCHGCPGSRQAVVVRKGWHDAGTEYIE
eukprot:1117290-Pleurochrysis_carterae.AAC.1